MLEEDLEPILAGWVAGERLRAAGIWFGERPEGVFWPSIWVASLAAFGVNFGWEVTWRRSGVAEDVEGGL